MESPQGIKVGGGNYVKKAANKRILYIILGVSSVLIGSMVWAIVAADPANKPQVAQQEKDIEAMNKPLVITSKDIGSGILQRPLVAEPNPEKTAPQKEKMVQVVMPPMTQKQEQYFTDEELREMQEIRRARMQLTMQAVRSEMSIRPSNLVNTKQQADVSASGTTSGTAGQTNLISTLSNQQGSGQTATPLDSRWASPHQRMQGQPYEIKTGGVVPAVLLTGINSELKGTLIAQVSQNVYDSATGAHLLVPQGTKLFGVYDSGVQFGQSRVFVAWNRLVFPDGSAMTLEGMQGTDAGGYSGLSDLVDNHYLRIFGTAILMSGITGGMSYAVDSLSNDKDSDRDSDKSTMQREMGTALANQLGQTSMALLQKNLNVAPTIEVRTGYKLNVIVMQDLIFTGAYHD